MNKASIKTYAIWARNELISRVSQQAYEYGVEKDNIVSSDADSINGRLLSNDEKNKRRVLISQVNQKGYDQVMEEAAYTWFNRFIALRFMEVNNYLPNKVRLFTNESNEFKPQILEEALHIDLLGLDKDKVIALKEANNNEELYKELLLATCNDMSQYLPGMFKPISEYMTLLFPSNLLREESILGRLISDIDEDSWTDQVQIIGWLYQYYNTEPKEKTFADLKKNIKINKNTIAPVTQLFTPDWIVRYMTENSLGRLWLDGHPDTDIRSNWKYYLDEAKQEESVQIELNKIKAAHAKLKPEDIKFLDPCMGSGHILVYAFDVFMQIYVSEGWTEREAAKSILENNLYGLDIDERAYQLSYFALMMKARQYNRRILTEGIVPNVMAIEESNTFNKDLLTRFGDLKPLAERVVNIFIDAKEYGSILNIEFTKDEISALENKLNEICKTSSTGNLVDQTEADQVYHDFYPLFKQAKIMSQKYECVVTNPPYMGNSGMSDKLNTFIKEHYPDARYDLFAAFMELSYFMVIEKGYSAIITQHSWMFLSSYEELRNRVLSSDLINMCHLGARAFEDIGGEVVQTTAFVRRVSLLKGYRTTYCRLVDANTQDSKEILFLAEKNRYLFTNVDLLSIPGNPLSYWVSKNFIKQFTNPSILSEYSFKRGIATGNNPLFLRYWYEVAINRSTLCKGGVNKWFPYNKGGEFRKWYGNRDYFVNWEDDGFAIRNYYNDKGKLASRPQNIEWNFAPNISYSSLTSGLLSFREYINFINDQAGNYFVATGSYNRHLAMALLNSCVAQYCISLKNDTLNTTADDFNNIPLVKVPAPERVIDLVEENIRICRNDWDSFETSWDFSKHPLVRGLRTVKESFEAWKLECSDRFNQLKSNEEELNRIFIDIYGLQNELTPEVDTKDITVRKADLQREVKSLISYAVGCMFGRYTLDVDSLAYAGGKWDDSKYKSFIPDKDNIIPICDDEYFEDDIVGKFINFIEVAYGENTLEENLQFVADALGGKGTSREAIRNYFLNDFYNDHLKVYQKRPIYWQFDSGKKNGFKALVYIHRYTPDLIARMRTSYVHEQQSRYENQNSMIQNRIDTAGSTSERVKAEKELKKLKEQAEELRIYEEKIHHWADKMEPMDLDDGVKANYAKFQELLAKIK